MAASLPLQSTHQRKLGSTFEFTGCKSFPLSAAEMADYDGRYEYWEAGVAWELRDVSPKHERPSARLAELVADIAKMRGTPIEMFRTADLQERGVGGTRIRAVQADELVYLDYHYEVPDVFVVGELPLPDVVFEVDLTTDIRDRKLDVYAAWGIPELWVEVPDADLPSKRKRPGLTIHLLEDGRFRESAESVAFPTLSAREIHAALNEPSTSAATVDTVRRVGGIMGRRTGTGPEDDPFLGVERRLSRRDERMSLLEGVLRARGIRVTPQLQAEADRIAALPKDLVIGAALESSDLDDFLRRLRP
ncbi:MAG: Uma2 family endonuclease [Gammaproteobacteria bacterium]|nr:Uma2 family endonuclease [Gammaproteobacteria bacterium]